MRRIIVIPTGGLCNRMRTIVGAASLADVLNCSVSVIWTQDATLNAKFSDLFEPLPFPVKDVRQSSICHRIQKKIWTKLNHYMVIDDEWILSNTRNKPIESYIETLIDKNILIISCQDIIRTGDYSIFKPIETLRSKILPEFSNQDIIGIHIRRTDSVLSIRHSPTSLFVEKIHEELNINPDRKFFVATDDPKEEQTLKNEFGDHILIHKKQSLDRNTPAAIYDAVVDLYSLSICSKIYASYFSSFSDIAALLGRKEKIVLKA